MRPLVLLVYLCACSKPAPQVKASPCPIVWARSGQDSIRAFGCSIGERLAAEAAERAAHK